MSYSISVRGKTIAAALSTLASKFDSEVVVPQYAHRHDRETALAAAEAQAKLLRPMRDDEHVVITLSGSLGWIIAGDDLDMCFVGANTNAGANFIPADSTFPEGPVAE